MNDRRNFFKTLGILAMGTALVGIPQESSAKERAKKTKKPDKLKLGDTVGLVSPGGFLENENDVEIFVQKLESWGFKAKIGQNVKARHGYLAGTDRQRADDINAMFADTQVKAIVAMRGGWGCARILELLDYKMIKANSKILIGYSDITALLLAIEAKTGLVGFHGPVGISSWTDFSKNNTFDLLLENKLLKMTIPEQKKEEFYTIRAGKAQGKLLGGNLSVLAGLVGSEYVTDFKGAILFLEDVSEEVYRIDRMLAQLKIAGILPQISGFVFGNCSGCEPKHPEKSFNLQEVLRQHIEPLGIPAFVGAAIGHIANQYTIPLGIKAEINADLGEIILLENALK